MNKSLVSKLFLGIFLIFFMGTVFSACTQTSAGISITAPTTGNVWHGQKTITWDVNAALDNTSCAYEVYYQKASVGTWVQFGTSDANATSFSWNVNSLTDGNDYRVRLQIASPVIIVTSNTFTIDNTAPTISATAPATNAYIKTQTASYTFSEAAAASSGKIIFTRSGGTADSNVHTCVLQGTALTATAHTNLTMATNGNACVDWANPLVSGTIYTVTFDENDGASNPNAATTVTNTNVTYDSTAPVITLNSPSSSTSVKTQDINYTLSETLNYGVLVFTKNGGTDVNSPHTCVLQGTALTSGTNKIVSLATGANACAAWNTLVDGIDYNITFDGNDLAGNNATQVAKTNVTYDVTAPIINSVDSNATASGVLKIGQTIVFTVDINVTEAGLTILPATYNGGTLTWAAQSSGDTYTATYTVAEGQTDHASTPLQLTGVTATDSAGNISTPVSGTDVNKLIDAHKPVITATAPAASAYIKTARASYTLSEAVASGTITFTRDGGTADSNVHTCTLQGTALATGAHTNLTMTTDANACADWANPLVNGSTYTVTFDATDAAGNNATQVSNTTVTYDTTAPAISATAPAASAHIKSGWTASYTLSEAALSGAIVFTGTAGTDVNVVHTCTLQGTALDTGAHTTITLAANANICVDWNALVNGSTYTVTFNATDLAGNVGTTITNTGVVYDSTAPVISAAAPAANARIKTQKASYTLSETALSGAIVFTRTGGTADSNVHTCTLQGTALNSGAHTNLTMTTDANACADWANPLVDGSIYTVTFDAADLASNAATTVTDLNVTYDITAPIINSVTSNATASGTLKIGNTIVFTVDINVTEAGLTILPATYNGGSLTWAAQSLGDTYTATYTVVADQNDHTTALQLTGVTATDATTNVSTPVSGTDVNKAIDAHRPIITYTPISTTDTTPTLTGTINETGTVNVTVNSNTYAATVTGTTWSADVTDALTVGNTYTVVVDANDTAGNAATTNTTTAGLSISDTVYAFYRAINQVPRYATLISNYELELLDDWNVSFTLTDLLNSSQGAVSERLAATDVNTVYIYMDDVWTTIPYADFDDWNFDSYGGAGVGYYVLKLNSGVVGKYIRHNEAS